MAFPTSLKHLCTPAYIYFMVSIISLIAIYIQNIGNTKTFSLGYLKSKVPNTTIIMLAKLLYIFFWSWILNLICKDGHTNIAWFLVLLPFILFSLVALMLMID